MSLAARSNFTHSDMQVPNSYTANMYIHCSKYSFSLCPIPMHQTTFGIHTVDICRGISYKVFSSSNQGNFLLRLLEN